MLSDTRYFYTSYSTAPQEKVKEIKKFIDEHPNYGPLTTTELKRNDHDFGEYLSLEVYRKDGDEYYDMEDYDELDEEQDKRFEELEGQLDRLNSMEDDVSEKFGNWL